MQSKKIFRRQLIAKILFGFCMSVQAMAQQAELVWVDYVNGQHHIQFAEFDGHQWLQSEPSLYLSHNALTAVNLGTNSLGDKLLIWTEQIVDKTVLKLMRKDSGKDWSKSEVLYAAGNENFAGSIVYDANDTAWFFWSSVDQDLADIVYVQFIDGKAGFIQRLHLPNDVPDIHPVASLNAQGSVQVEWSTFDMKERKYKRISKTLEAPPLSVQAYKQSNELQSESIPLPDFLPKNGISLLHFPGNKMLQSSPLSP